MDFLKSMLGGKPNEDDDADFNPKPCLDTQWETMEKGIDAGRDMYEKVRNVMVSETRSMKEGDHGAFVACVAMFTCAHMMIGWLWTGVRETFKKDGKSSQVWRVWKVLEAAFACGPDVPMSEVKDRVAKVSKEIEGE